MAALRRGGLVLLVLLGGTDCGARSDLELATEDCVPGQVEPCEIAQRAGARLCDESGHWGACATMDPVTGSGGSTAPGTGGGSASGGTVVSGGTGTVIGGTGTMVGGSGAVVGGTGAVVGGGGTTGVAGGGSGGLGGGGPLTCAQGAANEFYVISPDDVLYRIDPETLEVLSQTTLPLQDLNSLALTADGTLYASSWYGELDTIDVANGTIEHQPFDPYQYGNNEGVCIGWADVLPEAPDGALLMSMGGFELYAIDEATLAADALGNTSGACEIVGAEDGRVFALATNADSTVASIEELDSSDYQMNDEILLPGTTWSSHDIAYFQGALYAFGGGAGTTTVYASRSTRRSTISRSSCSASCPST